MEIVKKNFNSKIFVNIFIIILMIILCFYSYTNVYVCLFISSNIFINILKHLYHCKIVVKYVIIIQNKIEENIYYSPYITYIVEEGDKILIKQYKRKRDY